MTGTARALIVFNIGAAILLTALTIGALSDSRSATGQGITRPCSRWRWHPRCSSCWRVEACGPERWWALCVLIPLTTVALKAAERRLLTPERLARRRGA